MFRMRPRFTVLVALLTATLNWAQGSPWHHHDAASVSTRFSFVRSRWPLMFPMTVLPIVRPVPRIRLPLPRKREPSLSQEKSFGSSQRLAPLPSASRPQAPSESSLTHHTALLAQLIQAEAGNQPFLVQLCVGDVVLNRMQASGFPHHLAAVIQQPEQFSSVANGTFARAVPTAKAFRAAHNALSGWDPVRGDLYYYNPSLPHSAWMNTLTACQAVGALLFCPAPS